LDLAPVGQVGDEKRVPPAPLPGRRAGLPQALAGRGVQATQLAVAADAVDVRAVENRRAHDRVQPVGVDLAVALALPDDLGTAALGENLQHQRPVVQGGDEQPVAGPAWYCNAEP